MLGVEIMVAIVAIVMTLFSECQHCYFKHSWRTHALPVWMDAC